MLLMPQKEQELQHNQLLTLDKQKLKNKNDLQLKKQRELHKKKLSVQML
jgi:hypothetical protein